MKLAGILALVGTVAAAPKIDVYSAPGCTYCNQLKDEIKAMGLEYNSLPLSNADDSWGKMQQRAMSCCAEAVEAVGQPKDVLILMPQLFVDDQWAGSNRNGALTEVMNAALRKAAYTPTDAKADHVNVAYDLLDAGDHEAAIDAFRAATKFPPTKFKSANWFNLGVALVDEEARGTKAKSEAARKEAAHAFAKALQLDPKNEDAAEELAKKGIEELTPSKDEL